MQLPSANVQPPSSVCGGDRKDHSRIHMSPLCGTWQDDYKLKHAHWRAQLTEFVRRGSIDRSTGLPVSGWQNQQAVTLPKLLVFVCSSQE